MTKETEGSAPFAVIIDLAKKREDLEEPLRLIAWVMRLDGARIISRRPGRIEMTNQNKRSVIRITLANPFEREAALYVEKGEAIPQAVLYDLALWRREHGLG